MNIPRNPAIWCLVLALSLAGIGVASAADRAGDFTTGADVSASQPRPEEPQAAPSSSAKSQDERALEIAPQVNTVPPSGPAEMPAERAHRPSDETAPYEQYQRPGQEPSPKTAEKLPYLGVVVEYTLKTFAGQEDHGLEVISIDSGSPAEQAGLKGRGNITALGAAGVTAGALLGPLTLGVLPLLQKTGQLGKDGDLIVAADDRRLRSEFDLQDELRKLKPGDTIYLTVVRASSDGARQTLKIPVRIGGQSSEAAAQAPAYDPYSAQSQY
jgi:hypothetical protein